MIWFVQRVFDFVLKHLWFYNPLQSRYIHLQLNLAGLQKTGISWVGHDGMQIIPFCATDDIGIYWLIPRIALFLNISIENSIRVFFYGIAFFSWSLGLVGIFLLYRSYAQKIVAAIGLTTLLFLTLHIGDVYIVYSSVVMAIIPLGMYLCLNETKSIYYLLFGLFVGFFIGIVHFCRSYSSFSTLLFMMALCCLEYRTVRLKKYLLIGCMLLGIASVVIFVQFQKNIYNSYIKQSYPTVSLDNNQHGIWHTIYCGFGFLKFMNAQKIRWDDAAAGEFVKKNADNNNLSSEQILKNEVLRLFKEERHFVIFSFFGKLGILLLFFLLSMNLGIIAAVCWPKPFFIDCAFILALAASAIFPLLAMPFLTYSLNFISFAVMYSIVSINYALHIEIKRWHGWKNQLYLRIKNAWSPV